MFKIEMIVTVSEKTNEIVLAGSAKDLDLLSRQLLVDNTKVNLEYKNHNPFPYSSLQSIQIRHIPNQSVKISVEDKSLLITGSPEKLNILSENIKTEENELKDYHIHIEYFEGHFYLSEDSIPLVISFQ